MLDETNAGHMYDPDGPRSGRGAAGGRGQGVEQGRAEPADDDEEQQRWRHVPLPLGLEGTTALQTLILSHNRLASTEGIDRLTSLKHLDISHNVISSLHEVSPVSIIWYGLFGMPVVSLYEPNYTIWSAARNLFTSGCVYQSFFVSDA